MSKHLAVKKSLILLVAALLVVTVFLTACNNKPHPTVTIPTGSVGNNGGVAVTYGEWIYYVNGYQSDVNAENTYVDTTDAPRIGSVVRIKAADLADILAIREKDLTETEKTKQIAAEVNKRVQIVIPQIYYSGNTDSATAQFNGIHIFGDRIYILTPNDQLTPGGNPQTSQAVLMSYDLGGGNPQRHFTFTSNSAQIWLYDDPNASSHKVMATYLLANQLHVLTVGKTEKESEDKIVAGGEDGTKTVSSVKFDKSGNCVFFINSDGAICKLNQGSTAEEVIVANEIPEGKDASPITYTIVSANNGSVYYTVADSDNTSVNGTKLYYADSEHKLTSLEGERAVALNTTKYPFFGWRGDKIVIVNDSDDLHGLYINVSPDGKGTIQVLQPGYNKYSITINNIEGDLLYYTANNVTYVKDLSKFVKDGEVVANEEEEILKGDVYAYSLSTTPTVGWALADRVEVTVGEAKHVYVFSLASGSVSVVEFDSVKKTNSTATTLTKTASED